MKKILGIALASLFFLILLAFVVYRLFIPHSTQPTTTQRQDDPFKNLPVSALTIVNDTPYRAAVSCYTWYLAVSSRGATPDQIIDRPETQQCFTPQFIESWKEDIATTETDPVLLSAGYYDSWLTSLQARINSQLSQTSNVEMLLGTGNEVQRLMITLRQTSSGWRIDSVL